MEIHQLQYVLAVARYRNFTIAAESCYISQSSLSQQIANLEKELGVCLFKRSTRTLQITEAGETFVKMASEILGSVDRLGQTMSDYAGFLRGTINIGAITALEKIGFSDMVSDFYAAYPNLTLNIYHGKSLSLLEELEKRTVDVAFLAEPPDGEFPNITYKLMGQDEYALLIPENHRLAHRNEVDLAELKDERFILQHPEQTVSRLCMQACKKAGFTPNVVCRIDTSAIIVNLVRTGFGVAFLPAEELECFRMDGLRCLRLTQPIKKRIVMAMLTKNTQSHLVDAFIRFVENRMGQPTGQ